MIKNHYWNFRYRLLLMEAFKKSVIFAYVFRLKAWTVLLASTYCFV